MSSNSSQYQHYNNHQTLNNNDFLTSGNSQIYQTISKLNKDTLFPISSASRSLIEKQPSTCTCTCNSCHKANALSPAQSLLGKQGLPGNHQSRTADVSLLNSGGGQKPMRS